MIKMMNERRNKKGFTLAELLIVVAIIAVLVAIAIPIFTTQLEKSREGTDIANLRAAYAAGQVAAMDGKEDGTYYFNPGIDGSLDNSGIEIGKGTKTNGKADVSALTSVIEYSNSTEAAGQKISVTIGSGAVTKVKFG